MKILKGYLSGVDGLNRRVEVVGLVGIVLMVGISVFEVILRFVFDSPTIWAYETVLQLFGFYLILGGGYVALAKAHVKVDILWRKFSPRTAAIVDLFTGSLTLLFAGLLVYTTAKMAGRSVQIWQHSMTVFSPPVYPLKIGLVLGASLLLLQLIAKLIRDLHMAIKGVDID